MPQSLSRILIHLVFSTKDRRPLIQRPHWNETHAYMAGVLRNEKCPPITVGGVEDHVHLLFGLSRTLTIAEVVEKVKTSSTKWAKSHFGNATFCWQNGYGAFSIGMDQLDTVANYIRNQERHHEKLEHKDEFRELLNRYEVSYDERYVWD